MKYTHSSVPSLRPVRLRLVQLLLIGAVFFFQVTLVNADPSDDLAVTTLPATSISKTGVTFNAEIDLGPYAADDIGEDLEIGFFMDTDEGVSFEEGGQAFMADAHNLPNFSLTLPVDTLECGTEYYFAAVAESAPGGLNLKAYGEVLSFTTLSCEDEEIELPVITTLAATDITQTNASMRGEVIDTGGQNLLPYGFHINKTPSAPGVYENEASDVSMPQGMGEFSLGGEMFECGTTYYYRAYGTNDAGTAYGDEASFSTLACEGEVVQKETTRRVIGGASILSRTISLEGQGVAATLPVRDLQLMLSGEDVRKLQQLLNANGFVVAKTGPGAPGQETTYFGALTRQALAAYQRARGITPAVGYFGPITRAQMKASGLAGLWW